MAARGKKAGFTLVELVIVVAVIATLAAIAVPELTRLFVQANVVDVQSQAKALRTLDIANRTRCQDGGSRCVDIQTSGNKACEEGVEQFLPDFYEDQVENGRYSLINISSKYATAEQRQTQLENKIAAGDVSEAAAIFTVTRFLRSESTLQDQYNPEQPCILYIEQ